MIGLGSGSILGTEGEMKAVPEAAHGLSGNNYEKFEKFDCFNWLREKKGQGLVKYMGFSFHDNAELLDQILTSYPEMEFV